MKIHAPAIALLASRLSDLQSQSTRAVLLAIHRPREREFVVTTEAAPFKIGAPTSSSTTHERCHWLQLVTRRTQDTSEIALPAP
eukprot:4345154-Pleurochrysis_carterae.AAC.2